MNYIHLLLACFTIIAVVYIVLWKYKKSKDFYRCLDMVFLRLQVPMGDSKEDKEVASEAIGSTSTFKEWFDVMSHFYSSIYSIHNGDMKNKFIGEDFFSCEMVILNGQLNFYFVVPRNLKHIFEKQIIAFYPTCYLEQVEDYNFFKEKAYVSGTQFTFGRNAMFPIKSYKNMGADPINTIINVMSKMDNTEGAAVQIMLRPLGTGWQKKGREKAKKMSGGTDNKKSFLSYINPFAIIKLFFLSIFSDTPMDAAGNEPDKVTQLEDEKIKEMEEKNIRHGFESQIRVVVSSMNKEKSENNLSDLISSFTQYNELDANFLVPTTYHSNKNLIKNFILRSMSTDWWYKISQHKMILTPEEITSLFHVPDIRSNKSPIIKWQEFKIAEGPANLPDEGVLLGLTATKGQEREIRIKRDDRRKHFYIIGKSGTGKSTLLETCIRQDLAKGEGMCVIDPHGDLVETMMEYIPRHRADDVIYFNPGDLDRPMGLNILEAHTEDQKEFMAQEALAIFIKMFGEEIMGPRLQHYFRNGVLTLMADDEEGATLLDIPRMFTDDAFAEYKQKKVTNAAVRQFWDKEMANTGQREKQEMIPYFSSKFGPFVTNLQIRNIIGQTKSGFDFRDVMDNQKILFVNLSKGKLGDLNAKLLGMIMVAKIQMAAMSRVDTPEEDRKDFYLYVDEFQNFVTDSFASILSEARKYRLNLIIAHQYISQITKLDGGGKGSHEDSTIKDAVFGNVGSMMCFKIGAADGETMVKEFSPVFSEQDLVNIANYHACIKLNIDNTTSRGFTMRTIYDTSGKDKSAADAFVQLSRLKFARDRKFVDKEIGRRLS